MYKIAGFLALSPAPCFAVPLFDVDGALSFQRQRDGRIVDFTPVIDEELPSVRQLTIESGSVGSRAAGDETVYGFQLTGTSAFTGTKNGLKELLNTRIDWSKFHPVVKLDILTFLDRPAAEIAQARAALRKHLQASGLESA